MQVTVTAVSVRDAAGMLGISIRTVWNLIHDDQIRSIKVRSRRLIPVSEINRVLQETEPAA